jgi:hypothetical protein
VLTNTSMSACATSSPDKVSGRGTRRFSYEVVYGERGLLRLETWYGQAACRRASPRPYLWEPGAGDRLRRPGGMGNGALPNGPSYRAHPRLYRVRSAAALKSSTIGGRPEVIAALSKRRF